MSLTSVQLKLTLQELDDNPDTWGDVLNASAIELLEDAIAGSSVIDVTSGDVTMDITAGGDDPGNEHYRKAIVSIIGSPGGDTRQIFVPALTKVYLVANNTGDASDVTVLVTGQTGVLVPADTVYLLYCDGTDVLATEVPLATVAIQAQTATDAEQLTGVDGAEFAQLDVAQTWTKGQVVQRVTLSDSGGDIIPDLALSNSFYHEMTQGENLAAPLNPTNGAMFSLVIEQGAGPPHALTFQANTFIWGNASVPTLSTELGEVDYFAFEYVTNLDTASKPRWIGSVIKNVGPL